MMSTSIYHGAQPISMARYSTRICDPAHSYNASPEEMEERTLSRKTGKAFLPFSQAELESLSPQARGRLTLDQVNTEYRLLWEYFVRKNPRSESALASAIVGLKPGKFGENLLRCLRALGVLTVDSRNNVVWLRK
ncbi:uncharacterized protein BJ171DRAFT_525142 [Polychytrium aggregatum]|uniref:uncharacterized protein n=1 Tax=Polychytrium aggregatum TaxID=110093 RepID=UPI0022FEFB25|nr:uncharacterized protein BJ171DRAFT_525142 [Polychytrium aggregatum]KAI9193589.1 hypothetical protein BJ171DRAFT_525142 [Polychytrium aggregatum]